MGAASGLRLVSRRSACYNESEMEVNKFVERLEQDFPDLRFRPGRKFAFRPPRTIVYEQFCDQKEGATEVATEIRGQAERRYQLCLLHELGHATLGHRDFRTDPERLRMEAAAWGRAEELSDRYGVEFDRELAEAELDSYRDWLHQRSRCPACGLTRYQTPDGRYHCPGCMVGGAE